MNTEIIMALIGLVSGGGLTALTGLVLDHMRKNRESEERDIDERIAAWQRISDKNERRIEACESSLECYSRDIKRLERYILELEQIIIRINPCTELPPHPALENDPDSRAANKTG